MSLIKNIDHLARQPGVVAILIAAPLDVDRAFRGAETWKPALVKALALAEATDEDTLRVAVGASIIYVQRERIGGELAGVVAVVCPMGHEIGKSIHRLIRRSAKGPRRERPSELAPSLAG